MYLKIHKAQHDVVVAVCDEDLIGKTLEEGKYHIVVSEHFYKGEKKSAQEVEPILLQASNINLMGKESVAVGLKLKIITKAHIVVIAGVPHAQIYAQ